MIIASTVEPDVIATRVVRLYKHRKALEDLSDEDFGLYTFKSEEEGPEVKRLVEEEMEAVKQEILSLLTVRHELNTLPDFRRVRRLPLTHPHPNACVLAMVTLIPHSMSIHIYV